MIDTTAILTELYTWAAVGVIIIGVVAIAAVHFSGSSRSSRWEK